MRTANTKLIGPRSELKKKDQLMSSSDATVAARLLDYISLPKAILEVKCC